MRVRIRSGLHAILGIVFACSLMMASGAGAQTESPASKPDTKSTPIDAATETAIAANLKLLTDKFGAKVTLDRDGIAYLDSFIRRMPANLRAKPGSLVGVIGSHLGATMVRSYKGRWIQTGNGAVGVRMGPMFDGGTELTAFPFSKVGKHIANGQEDSILSFFLIAERLLKEKASATATQ